MSENIVIALIAFAGTLLGSYFAQRKTTALVVYRLEQLENKVDKHNSIIERMYKVEQKVSLIDEKIKVANHRIDDLEKEERENNMDIELLKNFIKPELLILIPVLYFIGVAIKNTLLIKDKFIPLTLGSIGVALAVLWILATEGTDNIYMAVFVAITQGFLCAGASVYINQIIKQSKKAE